jgi:hypothetical protein
LKIVFLLLLLYLQSNALGDDSFPIELTCEAGGYVLYFHLGETKKNSWWKPHNSTASGGGFGDFFLNDKFKNRKNQNFKKYKISEGQISFTLTSLNGGEFIKINRYTLGLTSSSSGQCFKGLKTYDRQI